MTHRREARDAQRGSALIIVVGYLAIVTIFAAAFLSLLNHTMSNQSRSEFHRQCLHIAEAGIEKALIELHKQPDGYRGEQDTPLGDGRFSVYVERGGRPGAYQIVSAAIMDDSGIPIARAQVTAEALLAPNGAVRELRWRTGVP